jgi:glycerate kinase
MSRVDVVVTGEGGFDGQSRQGKVTGRIIGMAEELGKPVAVFAGRAEEMPDVTVRTLASIQPDAGEAMTHAAGLLKRLAREWAETQVDG